MELPDNHQDDIEEQPEPVNKKPNLILVYISLGIASIVFGAIVGLQQWEPNNNIENSSKITSFTTKLINSYENQNSLTINDKTSSPIIINFWASWCGPCRVEMKHIQKVWEKYEGEVLIIGIATQDTQDAVENFVSDMNVTYPITIDIDSSLAREYRISRIPTTIFVDNKGNIHKKSIGIISDEFIENTIIEMFE